MYPKLNTLPWATLSLTVQFLFAIGIYYLYCIDFGYGSGREFSFSLSMAYSLLLVSGALGTLIALVGMYFSIGKDGLWTIFAKYLLVFLPCLFLSVFWFYSCLALLAYL